VANEVNINITANNLTGPGFAGAAGNAAAFAIAINQVNNSISNTGSSSGKTNTALAATNGLIIAGTASARLWTTVSAALNSQIKLFGGALTDVVPHFLSAVSGWHLLTEAVIETAAIWGPAAIAITAFGVVAAPVVEDLTQRMDALHTSSTALGQAVYPLSGGFKTLADSVKPEVYTLFGEALVATSKSSGTFGSAMSAMGKTLDDLGARFVFAITQGKGMSTFMSGAVKDFGTLGTAIGNFGGIIGTVFKAVPGYASILLGVGTQILHVVEIFTEAAEPVIAFGLAAHGAIIYLGLLVTAGTALVQGVLGGIGSLALKAAVGLDGLGVAGDVASEGMLAFGAAAETAEALPWGWILTAVGLIVGLGVALSRVKDDAQSFNSAIQTAVQGSSLNNLSTTLLNSIVQTQQKVASSAKDVTSAINSQGTAVMGTAGHFGATYNPAVQGAINVNNQYKAGLSQLTGQAALVSTRVAALSKEYGGNASAMALMNAAGITTAQITDANNQHWSEAKIEIQGAEDAMKATTQSVGRLGAAENALNFSLGDTANALGNNQEIIQKYTQAEDALLNTIIGGEQAWTTFQQDLNTMATDMKGTATNVKNSTSTYQDFINTVKNSTTEAARNTQTLSQAVGANARLSNSTSGLVSNTKALTNTMKDGEKQTTSYTQKVYSGAVSLNDLSAAGLKLSSDFYSSVLPAAQKTVDALNAQLISTKDLTTAVATEAGEMLNLAGNNEAARVAVASFINNALGPGTISLKSMNSWVGQNATSLQGFKSIVDKTMVSASQLAGVLQNNLNAMFAADLIKVSGAGVALQNYTKDLEDNTTTTSKGVSDRQKLITDLENSGMSAKNAQAYVDGLNRSIAALKGKSVDVNVQGSGTGGVVITGTGTAAGQGNVRFTSMAGGGRMPGYAPGQDSEHALLAPGEFVLVPEAARALGYGWLDSINSKSNKGRGSHIGGARYAGGGLAGNENTSAWYADNFSAKSVLADIQRAIKAAKAASAAAASSAGSSSGAGPVSGDAAAAQAYAFGRFGTYGWGASNKAPLVSLWNQESGWNRMAYNASSGATGIPQALPYSKMPKAAWLPSQGGSASMAAQVNWGEDYISGRYGDPAGAWAHEVANNWYRGGGRSRGLVFDSGGWLQPGMNNVFNGTGAPEHLTPTSGNGAIQLEISSGGQSAFEEFMLKMMRNFVRVKGGGDAQKAFGGKK
jgi:hypothetical protein